jgi:Fe-S-cluster containining protein
LSETVGIASLHDAESQRLAARLTGIARAMSECEGVDRFQDSGWLPDRFFTLLDELYAVYDAYITHNLSASRLNIRCRFGCTRCCHQAVHGVYAFEIINLYRKLQPLPDYREIHDALADNAAQFQATAAQIAEADDGDSTDPVMRALDAFAAAAQPCPLLAGNNCRVYAHRPAPCRMVHSLANPLLCTTPQGQTFHIEVPQEANEILWSLSDRLLFPFPSFLAQGLVTLAARRQFRSWDAPPP